MRITIEFESKEDADAYNIIGEKLFPTSEWSKRGYKIFVRAAENLTYDKFN